MLQTDESPEACQLGDLAGDEIPHLVEFVDLFPRIFAKLLDANRNALIGFIDFENDGFDFIALLKQYGRVIDLASTGDVRHVDHTIQALFEFDERTVAGKIANFAFDSSSGRIFLLRLVPRIGFELTQAERNLLLFAVDAEHDRFDFLVGFEDIGWLGDAFGPGEFGDVDETFDTGLEFDECAIRHQIDDLAFDLRAHRIFLFDVVPGIGELLLKAETDALFLAVDVENHNVDVLADLEDFRRMP